LRGDARVRAQLTRGPAETRLSLDANAAVKGGTPVWVGALGGGARLQLSAALTDQTLTIDRMLLTGRALSLSLRGRATQSATSSRSGIADDVRASSAAVEDVDARWELNVSDLAALSPTLAGTLKVSGRTKGPSNALSADGELTSTLSIRDSPRGTVSATLHAEGLPTAPRGTLQARGTLDGAPLQLNASLERQTGNTLHAVIRQADWKSAHIEGDLASGADMAQARGNLRLRIGQLTDLQRLLGTNVQGSVTASLGLTPLTPAKGVKGRTHAQLQFEAHNVMAGNLAANAQLTAAGPIDALSLRLAVQLPDLHGEPASLTSAALLNLTARELRLASAEAKYHAQVLRLVSPAQLSFANGPSITGLKLGAQQALLELEGRVSPALDLRASVHHLKPELINAFVPALLAKGTIDADAQLQGSLAAPTGHVRLEAIGMRLANDATRGLPAVDMHAGAQLMSNTALLDVKVGAGSASLLKLSGRAPLNVNGALDLKLAGKLDVGMFNPLLEARGQHAAGELSVDTTVTGSATAPEIGGTIRLARGNLRDYARGVSLSEITAEVVGSHGMLRIVSLTARAPPGSLSMTGTIGVLQPGLPVDVKLTAKNAQPIASNIVTTNLDADLHLSGKGRERLDVAGRIHVNRANIEIPNSLPPNVAVLDVRRPGQAPPAPSEKPLVIGLDITVEAPRQILVQGRGLDAELGGELHLGGTTDAALVSGGFDLQRGTFSLASSRLTFTMGSVTFNGSGLRKRIDPTLDFTAQSTVGDVTATLRITGLADSPKIELSSTPELPQDEILARLLFGEPAAQLTARQVAQIGAALATLSGGGGGLNPLAKIQKTLGLDRLSVGGGSNGTSSTTNSGASIEAGRCVSSRVFVGVKESTAGASQLEVLVDLSKHLKLQTRLGNGTATAQGTTPENDPGSSVGVAYQFEY
jgi:translocation and assembly module TamB